MSDNTKAIATSPWSTVTERKHTVDCTRPRDHRGKCTKLDPNGDWRNEV